MKKRTSLLCMFVALALATLLGASACASQPGASGGGERAEQQTEVVDRVPQEESADADDGQDEAPEAQGEKDEPASEDTEKSPEASEDSPAADSQQSGANDPANPPEAKIELAGESVAPLACGSTWTFMQDGEPMTVTTDAPHPVQYAAEGMPAVRLEGPKTVTVSFDVPATNVSVERWSEADIAAAAALSGSPHSVDAAGVASRQVDAAVADGAVSFEAKPGFRYALSVTFDAGEATYAFTVPSV